MIREIACQYFLEKEEVTCKLNYVRSQGENLLACYKHSVTVKFNTIDVRFPKVGGVSWFCQPQEVF